MYASIIVIYLHQAKKPSDAILVQDIFIAYQVSGKVIIIQCYPCTVIVSVSQEEKIKQKIYMWPDKQNKIYIMMFSRIYMSKARQHESRANGNIILLLKKFRFDGRW